MVEELQRCTYVLPLKKRKCRMLVKKGKLFCGEHAIFDPEQTERIPCPNDPKHTVNKSELEEHLAKRCNSRLSAEPWIVHNLNFIEVPDGGEERENGRPNEMQLSRMSVLIQMVFEKVSSRIVERILQTPLIEQYLRSNTQLGETHRKHLIQHSSIIGHLEEASLLKNDPTCCIIDLGAGRAQLSYWMARTSPKSRFLLIDHTGCRNKHDNKALQADPSLRIDRLRCSIEHMDLSKVDCIKDAEGVVAVCKHFCGSATDCGIRCLSNAIQRGIHICGFALAPCCHHKSTFTQYTGKNFLAKYDICGEEDFNVLRYFATWAVCGMRAVEPLRNFENESNVSAVILNECDSMSSTAEKMDVPASIAPVPSLWTREHKEILGRQAKTILEMGRAEYLQSFGYRVSVYKYVDFRLSPENLLIVGTER